MKKKKILILCPLVQDDTEWERTNAKKSELFDEGNEVTDIEEMVERLAYNNRSTLSNAVDVLEQSDDIYVMGDWKRSKLCVALEFIGRTFGKPMHYVTTADQTNFAVRKFGTKCPMQFMVELEPALTSETQCKPCPYCVGTNPNKQTVICKIVPDL